MEEKPDLSEDSPSAPASNDLRIPVDESDSNCTNEALPTRLKLSKNVADKIGIAAQNMSQYKRQNELGESPAEVYESLVEIISISSSNDDDLSNIDLRVQRIVNEDIELALEDNNSSEVVSIIEPSPVQSRPVSRGNDDQGGEFVDESESIGTNGANGEMKESCEILTTAEFIATAVDEEGKDEEQGDRAENGDGEVKEEPSSEIDAAVAESGVISKVGGGEGPASSIVKVARKKSLVAPGVLLAGANMIKGITVENLFEYQWPQEKSGEWVMLQEQVSEFLGIVSFKRKYPDLHRRPIDVDERTFLQKKGIVTMLQCDLGLTVLNCEEVHELMAKDFPTKWKDYAEVLRKRERKRIADEQRLYEMPKLEKARMAAYLKKATRATAEYNARFMRDRRQERRCYFDLQTMEIHYPLSTIKKLPPEASKVGNYPVFLLPGQFQEYYKRYTPEELRYLPVNTALYSPPKHFDNIYVDPNEASEPEDEEGLDEGLTMRNIDSTLGAENTNTRDAEDSSDVSQQCRPGTAGSSHSQSGSATKSANARSKKNAIIAAMNTCSMCRSDSSRNKVGEPEELIGCADCGRCVHPSCLELSNEMITAIKTYQWQCIECKTCVKCMDPGHEEKMMFCDRCDRGYHTFCVGLRTIPTGRWECPSCIPGADEPAKKKLKQKNSLSAIISS